MDTPTKEKAHFRRGEAKTIVVLIIRKILRWLLVLYERLLPKKDEQPQNFDNILFINLYGIGDFLTATPAIRAIKKRFPASKVTVLVTKEVADAAKESLCIDDVVSYSEHFFKVIKSLIKTRFDLIVSLDNSAKAHLITYLSMPKYRCGYFSTWHVDGNFRLFKQNLFSSVTTHRTDSYLKVAECLGCHPEDLNNRQLEIYCNEKDMEFANDILEKCNLSDNFLLVGVNPGVRKGAEARGWPIDRYAVLCDKLINQYGAKVMILGSKLDILFAKRIETLMYNKPVILAGLTTLKQAVALIKHCDVFITADTGPMHIAFAVNTPTIALFGPSDPNSVASFDERHRIIMKDVGCNPCHYKGPFPSCFDVKCMKAITVEDILEKFEEIIATNTITVPTS